MQKLNLSSIIRMVFIALILFTPILLSGSVTFASSEKITTVSELIEGLKTYDEQVVTLEVEAIGDIMIRGESLVFNGLDSTGAIGFWGSKDLSQKINHLGNYQQVGDTLEITGIYHLNCTEHGGDSDVHVTSLSMIQEGYNLKHPVTGAKRLMFLSSSLCLVFVILISILTLKKRQHQ